MTIPILTDAMQKVISLLLSVLITISMGLTAYSLNTIVQLDKRVAVIESTSFAQKDAAALVGSINDLKTDLVRVAGELSTEDLERRMTAIERRLEVCEARNGH